MHTCIHTHVYMYRLALHYEYAYIALQVISLQEAATGTQQGSIQHHAIDNNSCDTQQSSVHQPIPQYALPNKGTANNKDQEASSYAINYNLYMPIMIISMIHQTLISMCSFAIKLQ